MSIANALQVLANYRVRNTRAAQDSFNKGLLVLNSNPRLADDEWPFLEQLTLAAIDVGRIDIADECLNRLAAKFPGSPRVEVLTGIRMEATESLNIVLKYYDDLLEGDSANAAAWKRRISVLKRMGKLEKAIEELSQFVDTFYTELDAWLELAETYASCNQYTLALQTLSHILILAPQNPFYVLQFAETAFTANDMQLAIKMFLLAVEMAETDSIPDKPSEGIAVRAWWGVKLCCRRLMHTPSSPSASNTPAPKNLNLIDRLATEKVLTTYSSRRELLKDPAGKESVFNWMTPA